MKKYFFLLFFVALTFVSCDSNSIEKQMEKYAKEHMVGLPDTYFFYNMGIENFVSYNSELREYRKGLEQREKLNPAFTAEIAKVKALEEKYEYQTAYREREFRFTARDENRKRIDQSVWAIYDDDKNILFISMSRDSLPTYPVLHILRSRGEL